MRTIQRAIVLTIAAAAVLAPAAGAATTAAARGSALARPAGTGVTATISVGSGPSGAAANPRTSTIHVTNQLGSGTAPVINGSATGPATLDNLYGVSCVRGSFCMAVGDFLSPASSPSGIVRSLAEEWNGSGWRVLRSAEATGFLAAVSCTSVSFCMAVGEPGAAAGSALAEAWNGSTWRVVKAPPGAGLSALSCATASFCVAVPSNTVSNVAGEWNGRAWHLMNMSGDSCGRFFCVLSGISCPRPQDCMAVGTYTNHAGTVVLGKALKWNGSTWRDTLPQSLAQNTSLAMISCPGASSCLAAGQNAIAWDGSSWRQLATPAALWVRSLSCPRPDSCMLVGGQGYGLSPASAQAWDGRTWRRLRPAQPGQSARVLFSVSCWRRPACMAVGSYSTMPTSPSGDALTLAERWNGTAWQVRSTPALDDPLSGLSAIALRLWRDVACGRLMFSFCWLLCT